MDPLVFAQPCMLLNFLLKSTRHFFCDLLMSPSGGRRVGGPMRVTPLICSFCWWWTSSPVFLLSLMPQNICRVHQGHCAPPVTREHTWPWGLGRWRGGERCLHPEAPSCLHSGQSLPALRTAWPTSQSPSSSATGEEDVKLDLTAPVCIPSDFSVIHIFLGIFPWLKIPRKIKMF